MKSFLFAICSSCLAATVAIAQSQSEMNQEAARNAARADKELNVIYKKVLAGLDDEGVQKLKVSQRAWIAYRDAEAAFAADEARGGSMAPMLYSGTIARLTMERIEQLKLRLPDSGTADAPPPAPPPQERTKPKDKPKGDKAAPARELDVEPDGGKTQAQVAQLFFDAYKLHDRRAAQSVASKQALDKLAWSSKAGSNDTLRLMDNTHIYYEGGSIELIMTKNQDDRWIIIDVKLYAD